MPADNQHRNNDEEARLKYRPGQPVAKDKSGREVGESPGPGSVTGAPVSSGGSIERVDSNLKGENPVAEGTEEGNYGKDGEPGPEAEPDRGPRGTPATS